MKYDEIYLSQAIELAKKGRFTTSPNPNVGCIIVRDQKIVGQGYHKYTGGEHAEIYALKMAKLKAKGATAYITLEPCNHYGNTPPCTEALINAGISRVVIATLDPNPKVNGQGVHRLKEANIHVTYNLMSSEAEFINRGFFKRMRTGIPWTILKLGASLDGRTTTIKNKKSWITSYKSRKDVQIFRSESDAILSTAKTIITDDPMLNVRWNFLPNNIKSIYPKEKLRQPIRVIVDSSNHLKITHKVVNVSGNVLLARIKKDMQKWPKSVEQILLPLCKMSKYTQHIDINTLMLELGKRKINNVFVEVGATFSGILLTKNLIDELIIYFSPKFLGESTNPLFYFPQANNIKHAFSVKILDMRKIGPDIRLVLKPEITSV